MTDKLVILKEIKTLLVNKFKNDIKDIILFGSHTTDKAHEFSDYDILVVLNRDYDWKYENDILDKVFDVSIKYNVLIDVSIISVNEISDTVRGNQPIFINALKKGIYA